MYRCILEGLGEERKHTSQTQNIVVVYERKTTRNKASRMNGMEALTEVARLEGVGRALVARHLHGHNTELWTYPLV